MSDTDVSQAAVMPLPLLRQSLPGAGALRLGDGDAVHDTAVTDVRHVNRSDRGVSRTTLLSLMYDMAFLLLIHETALLLIQYLHGSAVPRR